MALQCVLVSVRMRLIQFQLVSQYEHPAVSQRALRRLLLSYHIRRVFWDVYAEASSFARVDCCSHAHDHARSGSCVWVHHWCARDASRRV